GNAASGTSDPQIVPSNAQMQESNGAVSATPSPAPDSNRPFAIGVSFGIVALIGLLIGAFIFFKKRRDRRKKVDAVSQNMQNAPPPSNPPAAGAAAGFPRESAILRQPKRSTKEMEQTLVATYRQTKIANRTTREMEEQMVAQFMAANAAIPAPPAKDTPPNKPAAVPRNLSTTSFYYEKSINEPATANNEPPFVPEPLRISTMKRPSSQAVQYPKVPYPPSTYDMYQGIGQGPYRESINIGYQPYNPDTYQPPPPVQQPVQPQPQFQPQESQFQPQESQFQPQQQPQYPAQAISRYSPQYSPQYNPLPGQLPRAERGPDRKFIGPG
ncbi:hypothetical protein K4K54_012006, partial [Colletotrichum sp. SAR 10_86]